MWLIQVMDELLKTNSMYEYEEIKDAPPKQPYQSDQEEDIINSYDPINLPQDHISETKVQVLESEGDDSYCILVSFSTNGLRFADFKP